VFKDKEYLWNEVDDSWQVLEDQINQLLKRKIYKNNKPGFIGEDKSSETPFPDVTRDDEE
jgi:hypothetical protein